MRVGPDREVVRVVAGYVLVAGAWILLSDAVVGFMFPGDSELVQTAKGLVFVAVTAWTLWVLLARMTARVRTEARHAASAERVLTQVVETVPVGVILLNDDGIVTFMNPLAEQLLGVALSEAAGHRFDELPVIDGSADIADVRELLRTGATDGLRLRGADGRKARAVLARAAEVEPDVPGSGWVVALADITDANEARLRAEKALERSERSYRELFDKHPQPMWVYDLETLGYLAVNDAAIVKYGWSREEFLAMTIADIRPAEEVPMLMESVSRVTEGFDDAGIWTHVDKRGRAFPVHVFSHTIDWNGRAAELVLVQEVARVE